MKNLMWILALVLLPLAATGYQAGPKSQTNFGKSSQGSNAAAPNSQTRSFSTYGTGRAWERRVQTQAVQTQVAGQPAKAEKDLDEPAPKGPFVDKADGQLSGLKEKIAGGGKSDTATSASGKSAAATVQTAAAKEPSQEVAAAADPAAGAAMPAGMDAVMQQMGQMQNMMNMMGAMGGAGAAGGAAGGMPAGMPDISALMGSMGAMGGAGAAGK